MNETVVKVGDAVWLGLGGAALALAVFLMAGLAWDAWRRCDRRQEEGDSR